MPQPWFTARANALTVAIFVCLTCITVGYVFVNQVFGLACAMSVVLLFGPFLVVAFRLHHRWPSVQWRELAYLAVLFCAGSGGFAFVVQRFYDDGLDRYHAEDV